MTNDLQVTQLISVLLDVVYCFKDIKAKKYIHWYFAKINTIVFSIFPNSNKIINTCY